MMLESPDGHAKFVIWSCTVAGSGSPSDFLETIVGGLERETGLKRGDAESVDFETGKATKVSLRGGEDSEESWNVYTLRSGDFYHALMLRATPLAMELNGPFYDEIAITFSGASKSP